MEQLKKTNGARSRHSTEESQVPWDTIGLAFLHQLEGKSNFMEGLCWESSYGVAPWAMLPTGPSN